MPRERTKHRLTIAREGKARIIGIKQQINGRKSAPDIGLIEQKFDARSRQITVKFEVHGTIDAVLARSGQMNIAIAFAIAATGQRQGRRNDPQILEQ